VLKTNLDIKKNNILEELLKSGILASTGPMLIFFASTRLMHMNTYLMNISASAKPILINIFGIGLVVANHF
jgi:hypothetical protein